MHKSYIFGEIKFNNEQKLQFFFTKSTISKWMQVHRITIAYRIQQSS